MDSSSFSHSLVKWKTSRADLYVCMTTTILSLLFNYPSTWATNETGVPLSLEKQKETNLL